MHTKLTIAILIQAIYVLVLPCALRAENRSYDLVVYGATSGGIAAAVAAHREGLKVALVDAHDHIGGMMTAGLAAADLCRHSTLGGFARAIFEALGTHYGERFALTFEPHVAAELFQEILESAGVALFLNKPFTHSKMENGLIRYLQAGEDTFKADYFIDATYEGDLMAQTGVSFVVGREGRADFNESLAGVAPDGGPARHRWPSDIPARDSKGNLFAGVIDEKLARWAGDTKVPAYNYRLTLTTNPRNQVRLSKPNEYSREQYRLLEELFKRYPKFAVRELFTVLPIKNGKFDLNNGGPFSSNLIGGSWRYPEGSLQERIEIEKRHRAYLEGLLYFLSTDSAVPMHVRKEISNWGYARDEFVSTGNWPPMLYVREGRRMRGEYVLKQRDLLRARNKPDPIAVASCPIESHHVQRVALPNGMVFNEGHVQTPVLPYQIPYQSILPKRSEVKNLLVPVALSATHIAYTSLRMEPVFMVLGESAGMAVALAKKQGVALHDLPYPLLKEQLLKAGQRLSTQWKHGKRPQYPAPYPLPGA